MNIKKITINTLSTFLIGLFIYSITFYFVLRDYYKIKTYNIVVVHHTTDYTIESEGTKFNEIVNVPKNLTYTIECEHFQFISIKEVYIWNNGIRYHIFGDYIGIESN